MHISLHAALRMCITVRNAGRISAKPEACGYDFLHDGVQKFMDIAYVVIHDWIKKAWMDIIDDGWVKAYVKYVEYVFIQMNVQIK